MPTYRITKPYTAKSRPILFKSEMIRAILDGRKTQTRRVIKVEWSRCLDLEEPEDLQKAIDQCPYGKSGDFLWVRETWATGKGNDFAKPSELPRGSIIFYKDGESKFEPPNWKDPERGKWRPSIFMPRWACRIILKITEIKVERVQQITYEDIRAEGITDRMAHEATKTERAWPDAHAAAFANLWDSINAKRGYSWESNPWVWVITFERIKDKEGNEEKI